jgi:hypothetical protein
MAQIRDTDIIRTPEVTVDPRLFVPEGVIDMSVKSPEIDPDNPVDVPDIDEGVAPGEIISDAGADNISNLEDFTLPTPNSVTVVEQTMRFGPDGRAVVDVVIEVEDVPGISNYDVRTTKG